MTAVGRKRQFSTAPVVGVMAGEPATDPLRGTQSQDPGPVVTDPPPRARTAGSGHQGRRTPRLVDGGLTTSERQEWRHRLRSAAGKLAQTYRAAEDAEDAWARLTEEAERVGVPPLMLRAALADAGLEMGDGG